MTVLCQGIADTSGLPLRHVSYVSALGIRPVLSTAAWARNRVRGGVRGGAKETACRASSTASASLPLGAHDFPGVSLRSR